MLNKKATFYQELKDTENKTDCFCRCRTRTRFTTGHTGHCASPVHVDLLITRDISRLLRKCSDTPNTYTLTGHTKHIHTHRTHQTYTHSQDTPNTYTLTGHTKHIHTHRTHQTHTHSQDTPNTYTLTGFDIRDLTNPVISLSIAFSQRILSRILRPQCQ